jgi:hypothetical protein
MEFWPATRDQPTVREKVEWNGWLSNLSGPFEGVLLPNTPIFPLKYGFAFHRTRIR